MLKTHNNGFTQRNIELVMSHKQEISSGVAVKVRGSIASKRDLLVNENFDSWSKYTMTLMAP